MSLKLNKQILNYNYSDTLDNLKSSDTTNYRGLNIRELAGLADYNYTWGKMRALTDYRRNNREVIDEIWHLEHKPVFTLGQAGKLEHIIIPNDIQTVKTDRGGQVTYHGPGQLVSYLLIDLKRKNMGIKKLICQIEQAVIDYLSRYDVNAHRVEGAPGIYVNGAKICSMGLRVRNGCTYHGISFNINMDLTPFSYINPCGYKGLEIVQLKDLNGPDKVSDVIPIFNQDLAKNLGYV